MFRSKGDDNEDSLLLTWKGLRRGHWSWGDFKDLHGLWDESEKVEV